MMAHVKSHTSSFEHFCIFICEFRQLVCFERIKSQHKFRLVRRGLVSFLVILLDIIQKLHDSHIWYRMRDNKDINQNARIIAFEIWMWVWRNRFFFLCAHVASGDFRDIPFKRRNKQIDQLDAMTSAVPLRWNK